jgi:hypothetical protein
MKREFEVHKLFKHKNVIKTFKSLEIKKGEAYVFLMEFCDKDK